MDYEGIYDLHFRPPQLEDTGYNLHCQFPTEIHTKTFPGKGQNPIRRPNLPVFDIANYDINSLLIQNRLSTYVPNPRLLLTPSLVV
jgi:hypothetical protein